MTTDEITLKSAASEDVWLFHKLQIEAFMPLYEKYHDDETSLAKETLEATAWKLSEKNADSYLIYVKKNAVGGVRIRHEVSEGGEKETGWIAPVFIIPPFQNKGIGQKVLQKIFVHYSAIKVWRLHTIRQEKRNCHLYEKCGFHQIGEVYPVNDQMEIVEYFLSGKVRSL